MITVFYSEHGNIVAFTEEACTEDVRRSENRWDWKTLEQAQKVAEALNERFGNKFEAIERPHASPRFDVIVLPQVGDDVSMGFNGDYYHVGKINKISKTGKKITTTSGKVFYRQGNSAKWMHGKTYTLIRGIKEERNPHF